MLAQGRAENGQVNPNQLHSYLENLQKGKNRAIRELTRQVFEASIVNECSKTQFVDRISEYSRIWKSFGFRQFLYESFLSNPGPSSRSQEFDSIADSPRGLPSEQIAPSRDTGTRDEASRDITPLRGDLPTPRDPTPARDTDSLPAYD